MARNYETPYMGSEQKLVDDIYLGCEIEDITAKVRGIVTGKVEYLDGAKAWLMQPPYDSNGNRIAVVEVQDAYAKKIGDGVYIKPREPAGFHVRSED